MQQHITVVGALNIAFGALGILVGTIICILVAGGGLISGDREAIVITSVIAAAIAFFFFLVSIPGIIGGIGVLKRKEWARILVMVLGVVDLINIPFGTMLGIYTLWVLTRPETVQVFQNAGAGAQHPA